MADELTPENPLTADEKARVLKAITETEALIRGINKARAAGLDVADQSDRARATLDGLLKLKNTYITAS